MTETGTAPTPACFATLLAAWNETNAEKRRALVEESVTDDVSFTDPQYAITGREAFLDMMTAFHARVGKVRLERTSAIDMHNDRARYAWVINWPDGTSFEGFDAVALNMAEMKVCRIDGFFGALGPA